MFKTSHRSIILLGIFAGVVCLAAIIPAVVPQAVPAANKRGTSTVFALAGVSGSSAVGTGVCDDGAGNFVTTGCISVSSGAVDILNVANGTGGWLATDCNWGGTGNPLSCPGGFTSTGPFLAQGAESALGAVTPDTLRFSSATHIPTFTRAGNSTADAVMIVPAAARTANQFLINCPVTGICATAAIAAPDLPSNQTIREIILDFSAGTSALTGTLTACRYVDYSGTIIKATLTSTISGSVTVDVRTVLFAAWTGSASASSITAAATPALVTTTKYQDSTLTGWTTTLAAGTMVCGVMSSPTTVSDASLVLEVTAN